MQIHKTNATEEGIWIAPVYLQKHGWRRQELWRVLVRIARTQSGRNTHSRHLKMWDSAHTTTQKVGTKDVGQEGHQLAVGFHQVVA
jgi:membrane-bound lytic murein transglycosylase B